jgi:hypothetical protein
MRMIRNWKHTLWSVHSVPRSDRIGGESLPLFIHQTPDISRIRISAFPAMTFHFDTTKGYNVIWVDDVPCVDITSMSDEQLAGLLEVTVDELWQCAN